MKYNYKQKDELDQFYTRPEIAKELIELIDLDKYELIIEPSAGDGSFSKNLPPDKLLAFDIDPKDKSIIKQDFLEYKYGEGYDRSKILCIGNPPFGKQGSLALKFINKCAEFADTIAFILPRSFKKHSMQSKINKNYHLYKEKICNECFLWKGDSYNVPSVFQIWKRTNEERPKLQKTEPYGFKYVCKEQGDVAIRRVGFYAGRACKELENKSVQSHYFIKVKNKKNINKIISFLNEYDKWERDNTTGPRSISKPEVNKVIKEYFE